MRPILIVAGTRPELIKLAPVVRHLHLSAGDGMVRYILTGQHYDDEMVGSSIWRACPSWPEPDAVLDVGEHEVVAAVCGYVDRAALHDPIVVVQGDTRSTLAGAKLAVGCRYPLVHVEAGLRCFPTGSRVPEEDIRVWVDQRADLLLCPSVLSAAFAQRDARYGARLEVTGQTGLVALEEAAEAHEPMAVRSPWVLLTLHRAEWDDRGIRCLEDCAATIASAARDCGAVEVVWPVHPRWRERLGDVPGVTMVAPAPYGRMAATLIYGPPAAIFTDSGGLVEEAYALGIRCGIVRDTTERWEAIMSGTAALVHPLGTADYLSSAVVSVLSSGIPSTGAAYCDPSPVGDPARSAANHILALAKKRR